MKSKVQNQTRFTALLMIIAVISFQLSITAYGTSRASDTQASTTPDLQIVVIEGEDGINVIKKNTAVRPVVEVRDKNKAPGIGVTAAVAGVTIYFLLPKGGPGATFANGAKSATVVTDANGRAVAPEMHLAGKGSFKIEVQASYLGQTVSRTITQTNFSTVAAAQKAGKVPGHSTGDEGASQTASSGGMGGGAGSAAGGAAAAGGSHALLIGGIVAAGAAAAGVGVYEATNNSGSSSSCSDQQAQNCVNQYQNSLQSSLNGFANAGCFDNRNQGICDTYANQYFQTVGSVCSCAGGPTCLNTVSGWQQFINDLEQTFGVSVPSSCQ